jgi:predicted ATPase/DNA-binding SARP family transcriptional activator
MWPMPAEIRVLGAIEIVADEGPVALGALQQRRLLAALATHAGETRSADLLIEALWNAAAPPSAAKVLQIYVSRLRKVLPATVRIRTRGAGYALELEDGSLDAARFERLLNEGREAMSLENPLLAASLLGRALALWRGSAYGEFAYEQFVRGEAERLEELRLVAVEGLIEAELALGRHAKRLPELRSLAAEHPSRERLQAQAMLALYRCGRHSEALDLYATTRAWLDEELGLEPSAELRELQRRILQHDPGLALSPTAETPPSLLPAPPNGLLGRERELSDLRDLLTRDDVRLLVLTGAGGSGKTRLALEAARETAASFANGAAFVELGPLRDPELVMGAIARAVGIRELAEKPLETLATALRARELLLVLDNAEHLRAATPVFVQLLAHAPRLTLLVTSRVVLHLSGEHVYPVEPLRDDAAVVLFSQRAREADRRFEPAAADEEAIRQICACLDGLPLAIELAASWVRTLALPELLARLEPRLPLLVGGPRDLPARQQTLRATLEWSLDLLTPNEQTLFARLAVLAGGCTLEAAEQVCQANLETLQALVDKNLLVREQDRYKMLETIREYALERLEEQGPEERGAVTHALAEYLVVLGEEASHGGHVAEESDLLLLGDEFDNVRIAVSWALAMPERELALRLAIHAERFARGVGVTLEEQSRWLDEALRFGRSVSPQLLARALAAAAYVAFCRGDFGESISLGEESLRLYGDIGDDAASIDVLRRLGHVAGASGSPERARRYYEQLLQLAEQRADVSGVYGALHGLGEVECDLGHLRRASELLQRSAALAREAGDRRTLAFVLGGIGDVALAGGELARAEQLHRQALSLARELEVWRLAVGCVAALAADAAAAGDAVRAGELSGGRDRLGRELGWPAPEYERRRFDRFILSRADAEPTVFAAAAEHGQMMSPDEIIDYALSRND